MSAEPRNFLFLQGPSTPFAGRLADRLKADGHRVHRINFCAGDALYWGNRPAFNFNQRLESLHDFLDEKYRALAITDQIIFGDRRPVHRPAIENSKRCGIRTHVFEEGYFRPLWVTLEREGTNAHSLLPRDPDWFRAAAQRLQRDEPPLAFKSSFRIRAFHDVAFHVAGLVNPIAFPCYVTHTPISAPVEYAGYLKRFSLLKLIRKREWARAEALVASGRRYYVLPLQLNIDAQIRDHSQFEDMGEVIEYVLKSFAQHAPADTQIVIKNHPLDMGLMNFAKIIRDCECRFDIAGRVVYLEDGDLVPLLQKAQGLVTVNSTVGLMGLEKNCPTLTLSDPIYNLRGLTAQSSLDDFWTALPMPDAKLYRQFRRVVMHATQINGGFYCSRGIELAVENSQRVVTAARSPLEELL